jgi:ubiquinol-cytochrome c reductase cytochrome b subunit
VFRQVWRWLDDRWPFSALIRLGLDEDIPGGSSFAYVLGSSILIVTVIMVVTGIWQLLYYVPTVDHAYDSTSYLRTQVPFGWLIYNLHYWGANAMVILVVLHMARVFIWGAYKKPREVTWFAGVILLLITLGLSFTGAALPWDERGYWAAEVGTSITDTIPIVGDLVKRLIRGGEVMGQLTLSRFFVVHAAILPGALLLLIGFHLVAFRRFGSVGPWDKIKRQRSGRFWPNQVAKDALVASLVLLGLIALAVYAPAPFAGPADPVDTSYTPKPEWNFLFLYEALKFFPGKLEPVGTLGLPTLAILLLVLLPFLDRKPERSPLRRPIVMLGGFIAAIAIVSLTVFGYYSKPGTTQTTAGPKPGASTAQLSVSAQQGARLFSSLGCSGCHRINGTGGAVGPDLSHEGTRGRSQQWLVTQIQNPKAHDPNTVMPPFDSLSSQQINQLTDYLLSLGAGGTPMPTQQSESKAGTPTSVATAAVSQDMAASIPGDATRGSKVFEQDCASCHGPKGTDNVKNPGSDDGSVPPLNPIDPELANPDPQAFISSIDPFLQHGSIPEGPSPQLDMPAFGDSGSLSQQGIADVEAYILDLNGVTQETAPTRVPSSPTPASLPGVTPTASTAVTATETTTATAAGGPPGPAASIIGSAKHGATLYERDCVSCHGPNGAGNVPNPGSTDGTVPELNPIDPDLASSNPQVFADNIDRIIQHGSIPDGSDPQLHMPAFGDSNSLTQQEIADLEAYVLQLNNVDRGQLEHPGLAPRRFFVISLGAFGLAGIGLGAVWVLRNRSSRHR